MGEPSLFVRMYCSQCDTIQEIGVTNRDDISDLRNLACEHGWTFICYRYVVNKDVHPSYKWKYGDHHSWYCPKHKVTIDGEHPQVLYDNKFKST